MQKVTLIPGDGIGSEISNSVLEIFKAASVPVEFEIVKAGFEEYTKSKIALSDDVYKSIEKNKIVLKGPLTTNVGTGFRSLNVLLRKKYDLFANIRPVKTFKNIPSKYENIDLVIFRENTEGLYIGEEYLDDKDHARAIKKISRENSERIIREAFEYAKKNNINKVTLAHKANILKITDGLFVETGRDVAKEFEGIELEEIIIDNMCMQLVMYPEKYNIIVTMNLYGDILSDLCAGLVGGLGLVPGFNIGKDIAIFEAVHGSAPDIAGKNIANPTALILSAIEMLKYMDMQEYAEKIEKALFKTFEDGNFLTRDIGGKSSTDEFTRKVISFV